MNPLRILLVEDDDSLRAGLAEYLRFSGFDVLEINCGMDCLAVLTGGTEFHVAIVDLGLPDIDGSRLVEHIRQHTTTRIIVLTAAQGREVPSGSYEAGADLFMGKPVESRELVAAVRSLAGRLSPDGQKPSSAQAWILTTADWILQTPSGQRLKLTGKEYQLMLDLAQAQGQLVSRTMLCQSLYARHEASAEAALSTQVKRLRKRLADAGESAPIKTAHGGGYAFTAPVVIG